MPSRTPKKKGSRQPQDSYAGGAICLSAVSCTTLIKMIATGAPADTTPPTRPRSRDGLRSIASGTGPA